ncbi:MAG: hypothetical protein Q8P67_04870, partial [archaeon]|nr:hypothetical protein [archaeon]
MWQALWMPFPSKQTTKRERTAREKKCFFYCYKRILGLTNKLKEGKEKSSDRLKYRSRGERVSGKKVISLRGIKDGLKKRMSSSKKKEKIGWSNSGSPKGA